MNDEAEALLSVTPARARAALKEWTDGVHPVILVLGSPRLNMARQLRLNSRVERWILREPPDPAHEASP